VYPPIADPWIAARFEDRLDNNSAGLRVGTAERYR